MTKSEETNIHTVMAMVVKRLDELDAMLKQILAASVQYGPGVNARQAQEEIASCKMQGRDLASYLKERGK